MGLGDFNEYELFSQYNYWLKYLLGRGSYKKFCEVNKLNHGAFKNFIYRLEVYKKRSLPDNKGLEEAAQNYLTAINERFCSQAKYQEIHGTGYNKLMFRDYIAFLRKKEIINKFIENPDQFVKTMGQSLVTEIEQNLLALQNTPSYITAVLGQDPPPVLKQSLTFLEVSASPPKAQSLPEKQPQLLPTQPNEIVLIIRKGITITIDHSIDKETIVKIIELAIALN